MIGKVKWFNKKLGYGFLLTEDGTEYFAHYSKIISDKKYKAIDNEDPVSFEIIKKDGKTEAINIKKL